MRLTGKANKLFQSYYIALIRKERKDYDYLSNQQILEKFYRLLPSQRWGIFQDWADSIGYCITVTPIDDLNSFTCSVLAPDCMSPFFETMVGFNEYKTRQEARNAAISKLNEIVNGQELTINEQ